MQKTLLALMLAIFAYKVQAQSNVSIYGLLDTGYVGSNQTIHNFSDTTKKTISQIGQSAENTSRLGFKGHEDLGGGLESLFVVELQLYPQEQALNSNANVGTLNRQSFVGLHQHGVGKALIGLQYTLIFDAVSKTDAGEFNNMLGDVISAGSITAGNNGNGIVSIGYTGRVANALILQSDSFHGFRTNFMWTQNNLNATQITNGNNITGGNTNANGWGIDANYTYHEFYLTAAYQALKQLTTASNFGDPLTNTIPWTSASPSSGTPPASENALNVQDNQSYLAATYMLNNIKLYGQWISRTAYSTFDASYFLKRQAEQIGIRGFLTPTVETWAQAGLGRYTAFGDNKATSNFNAWQLGLNYWLSKRTNLYAIYGQQVFSNAYFSAKDAYASANANNYALGIRHIF